MRMGKAFPKGAFAVEAASYRNYPHSGKTVSRPLAGTRDQALQVAGFAAGNGDGMIGGGPAALDDLQVAVLTGRHLAQQFLQHVEGNEPGTTTHDQNAARIKHLQCQRLQPSVSANGFGNGMAGAGKLRRIEHDQIEASAFLVKPGHAVKNIVLEKLNSVELIEPGVFAGESQCRFG